MEAKTLKKLNKNFDKTWETLNFSEQKEIVDFMLDTLKATDDFFKVASKKIVENCYNIEKTIDKDTKDEIDSLVEKESKALYKKVSKEDKLQNEINTTNNKQLLFSDIFSLFNELEKATESGESIITETDKIIKNGINSFSSNTLISSMVKAKIFLKTHNMTTLHYTSNQINKVEELFADYISTNDKEIDI